MRKLLGNRFKTKQGVILRVTKSKCEEVLTEEHNEFKEFTLAQG